MIELRVFILIFAILSAAGGVARAAEPANVNFTREIQPILADNCYSCHGPDRNKRKAELRWDSLDPKEGPFAPRDGYKIVVPGDLENSVLIMRITSDDDEVRMPPPKSHRHVTPEQVELIKKWVAQGAKWGKHWSLEVPKRPALPVVKDSTWARNPIDHFLLAKLEKEGLTPSAEASRETLIRRVTLDLTGLPPTLAEVDAFLADKSADAYAKVVDRLLASPRYGERMVWEWLAAARYADTNGYQGDPTRTMWPWRDWVIRAMNENLPYDQFITWQIAGDLIPNATQDQQLASAFNRNHAFNGEGGRIPEETRVENVMDRTDTTGTVFLGLTVGCAKCHDHKFDPIAQKEYYALSAYFNRSSETGGFEYVNGGNVKPVMEVKTIAQAMEQAALKKAVKQAQNRLARDKTRQTWGSLNPLKPTAMRWVEALELSITQKPLNEKLLAANKALEDFQKLIPTVMVMNDATPREAHVLTKGAYDKPAEKVDAGVPAVLNPLPKNQKNDRLALAKWLVDPANPLTARVTINRYWQQFFGIGIVKTVDDFGIQGERPVNPDLLDWLAVEFRESGWDVKHMIHLIVTSSAYRQSSKVMPESFERDPEDRLLARAPRFRLPAVIIRDQALAASGLLVEKIGGPPVKTYQPAGVWEEATFGKIKYEQDHGDSLYRRGVYTFWRRIVGPTEYFDEPARSACVVRPSRTNTPLQALTTLNDTTFVEAGRALAQRVMTNASTPQDRLNLAYRLVLSRNIHAQEQAVFLAALERLKQQYTADRPAALKLLATGESKRDEKLDAIEHAAYTAVCLTILNLDEALTKE